MSKNLVLTVIYIINIYIFVSQFAANCVLTQETEMNQLFNKIIAKNNISISSPEFKLRKRIFFENVNKVKKGVFEGNGTSIDTESEHGNQFGLILPNRSLRTLHNNRIREFEALWSRLAKGRSTAELIAELPKQFDWRTKKPGSIGRVKNQGLCGSCWAFATTGNIEALYSIKKNIQLSLSEQELMDCDKENKACGGGLLVEALKGIEKRGISNETCYPYVMGQNECTLKKCNKKYNINGFVQITEGAEDRMLIWLYHKGPIIGTMCAKTFAKRFKDYYSKDSIYLPHADDCVDGVNHAVLIVGYGVERERGVDLPYWLIKNSWGPEWGDHGFFKLYRGNNTCSISEYVLTALLD